VVGTAILHVVKKNEKNSKKLSTIMKKNNLGKQKSFKNHKYYIKTKKEIDDILY
jgi:hypothetical protein